MAEVQPYDIQLQHVAFMPDGGIQIGFFHVETDVKANGVSVVRTLIIPTDEDYDEEIANVIDATVRLVIDVLADLPNTPPLRVVAREQEDDDEED